MNQKFFPALLLTLLCIPMNAFASEVGDLHPIATMGKIGKQSGIYNNYRLPFGKSEPLMLSSGLEDYFLGPTVSTRRKTASPPTGSMTMIRSFSKVGRDPPADAARSSMTRLVKKGLSQPDQKPLRYLHMGVSIVNRTSPANPESDCSHRI